MPLAKGQFLQNPSSYWVVHRHHPHRGSNPACHRHCTQGYRALDHSANDADTNRCQKMLYELLYKENWCQQRVSKIKSQGRIRTRHRYLNLKNVRPRSDALDRSAVTLDNTYSRNLIYQLLHVEYWCKQRVTKIKRQGVGGRIRTRNCFLDLKNFDPLSNALINSATKTNHNKIQFFMPL